MHMGVTTHDIFGDGEGAQPALPGTYGRPPRGFRLPPAAHPGPVRLQIADLPRSLHYYQRTLGLRVLEQDSGGAILGPQGDDRPLVELRERQGARAPSRRGQLGLFHFAILLPDRPALGRFARHLDVIGTRAGAGDHLVSESFYLQDPDNLGIEVYADRPQSTWRRIGRELMMATDPVDVAGVVQEAGDAPWTGMPAGTVMGHIHLHVGDIDKAAGFYSEGIGFDTMVWSYPGALFMAAGGYHHHLGMNIWAGPGAKAPGPHDAQLLEWTLMLPDQASLDAAADSLGRAGYKGERGSGSDRVSLRITDPWGTPVRLKVA